MSARSIMLLVYFKIYCPLTNININIIQRIKSVIVQGIGLKRHR